MKYPKNKLISISTKVENNQKLTVEEIETLSCFTNKERVNPIIDGLKRAALPTSLIVGFLIAVFPEYFEEAVVNFPAWTNLSPQILAGVNYLWNLLGDTVDNPNIFYHIPNIVLYSVGIFGIKKIFEALDRKSWLDNVLSSQKKLFDLIKNGTLSLQLTKGHSILFVGHGDYIGMQFVVSHPKEDAVTVSEVKPRYSDIWNYYDPTTTYEDLRDVLLRIGDKNTGEYMFFPVKDDQIFLPGPKDYDLAPHKIDILCQNIRQIEKELGWSPKKIIIIGDKYHNSYVRSEMAKAVVTKSEDIISLKSISEKYKNITIIDPTDIVLSKILKIAKGRKIVFRATKEGIKEYKSRFYKRLIELGYNDNTTKVGLLTIGYDLFEDQTEQQTLSKKVNDYYPVVLSKGVHDALIRNGYTKNNFLYVPALVLETLANKASEQ